TIPFRIRAPQPCRGWRRIAQPLPACLEHVLSLAAHSLYLRSLLSPPQPRVGWRSSAISDFDAVTQCMRVPDAPRDRRSDTVAIPERDSRESRAEGEVVIVGGSAAGLFTAAKVAQGGRRVRVLESRLDFAPASRTLIVTDHFRNQLGAAAKES